MKIRILTFHREQNYGANLQAYALSYYLSSLGHDVAFIDYRRSPCGNPVLRFGGQWIGRSISSTREKFSGQIRAFSYSRKSQPFFEGFQQRFVPVSPIAYRSPRSIRRRPPDADCYIVGSDQVWSPKIVSERDWPIYFLDFGHPNTKKIAYSVSSGGELVPKELRPRVARYLEDFEAVGVREWSLGEHLADLGFPGAQWTPDPSILVDWDSHLGLASVARASEVGIFFLRKSSYERVSFGGKRWTAGSVVSEGQVKDFSKSLIDPLGWVREIAKKSVLVTDSFHAVLFALYTCTPFMFVKWGAGYNRDHRVISLLEQMNLGDKAAISVDLAMVSKIDRLSVDWPKVSAEVGRMRLIAESFLKAHIE